MLRRLQLSSRSPALGLLLVLTALTFTAGWAQKLPCQGHGNGLGDPHSFRWMCYSDVRGAWIFEHLGEGAIPYVDHPVEYPVLMGGLMALAAAGAHSGTAFFNRTSVLLLAGALIVTVTTAVLAGPSRRRDAALVALAPGAILHGTVNWDFAAAALAGLAMVAWAKRKPALAGVALGLGAATKFYPILFAVPLFVLCVRAKQLGAWSRLVGAAGITYVVCNAAAYAVAGSFPIGNDGAIRNGVLRFFIVSRERTADWDSVWFVIQELMKKARGTAAWTFPVPTLNNLQSVVLAAGLGALAILLWNAPKLPRVSQGLFLVTAIFLLSNKVYSPQYTIWLIPLAVLARPRWRPILVWQLLEVGLTFTRFQMFLRMTAAPEGFPIGVFAGAVVARDIALVYVMFGVVREIRHPEEDVVRATEGDPAGGVLSPAPAPASSLA